jgi:hypothetical protein
VGSQEAHSDRDSERFETDGVASSSDSTKLDSECAEWLAIPPQSGLPAGFRLLCVGPREPDWIGMALQLDAAGCHDPRLRWASTAPEAMTILRHETFECLVVADGEPDAKNPTARWDAVALIQAIRSSGCDDPLVYLAPAASDETTSTVCHLRCDWLISTSVWNSRALVAVIQRAIQNTDTVRQNHQLAVANHRRLVRERDEADQLLRQQRDIISELEALANRRPIGDESESNVAAQPTIPIPDEIKRFYQELLRTYVIMGSGNLGGEIGQLAKILAEAQLSPRDTLSLHLERVEELVRGLGNRSTRHVMARADLLAIELIIHLGECYQKSAAHVSAKKTD